MKKSVRATQAEAGLRFTIRTGSGHELVVDDATGNAGPRPAELLLAAQAGCTAMDVATILAKKRQAVSSYAVRVEAPQRVDRHPHVFERIEIVHELTGATLDPVAVARAIELSATRYCTVTAMLSSGLAEIAHSYEIRSPDGRLVADDLVAITGPGDDPDAVDGAVPGTATGDAPVVPPAPAALAT